MNPEAEYKMEDEILDEITEEKDLEVNISRSLKIANSVQKQHVKKIKF